MALVQLQNPWVISSISAGVPANGSVMDAAGESNGGIGIVHLPGGFGSKTISAAGGGEMIWPHSAATVTLANGSTSVSVGLQDIDAATGLEDGTFDVAAVLTGGVSTITASAWNRHAMTTGTKTLTQGQLVACVIEMTARGGADSIRPQAFNPAQGASIGSLVPYGTSDTGTLGKGNSVFAPVLVFDDGTLGWLEFTGPFGHPTNTHSTVLYEVGSSPDEYCGIFKLPFKCAVDVIGVHASSYATGDAGEIILYSDPLGTPSVIETVTLDPDICNTAASSDGRLPGALTALRTLEANTYYGIALRPTSANTLRWNYYSLGSGFDELKDTQTFTELIDAGRTGQSGAFAETQAYNVPHIWLSVCQIDDGSGGAAAGPIGRAVVVQTATQY